MRDRDTEMERYKDRGKDPESGVGVCVCVWRGQGPAKHEDMWTTMSSFCIGPIIYIPRSLSLA